MADEQINGTVTISTRNYHSLLEQRKSWQERLDQQREYDKKTIEDLEKRLQDLKDETKYFLYFRYDDKMEAWRPITFYLGSKACKENIETVFEIKELQDIIAKFNSEMDIALKQVEDTQKTWSESLTRFNNGSWSNVWHAIKLFFNPKPSNN